MRRSRCRWTVSFPTSPTLPCVFSPFRFHRFTLSYAVSAHLRFALSADFSQFVVTTANETACETSRDKPASLSSSTCLIYAFGLRFRYPFFSPTSHDVYLGSCYGVRRQLRPLRTFTTD